MNTERLGWTLLHFLWQGALIAAVYAAARRFLAGANARYVLACAALALMMAAPVATWCGIGPSDAAPAVAIDQTAKVSSNLVPLPRPVESGVPPTQGMPWLQWAVAIWLVGASALSIRLLGSWLMAARLRWTMTRPAPLEWCQAVERLGALLGLTRAVGLHVSAMVQSPVVIGAWRPLVLVPVGMLAGLPAAQVEALLMHELEHIRRHDYLVNILQRVAEALLFYHPAVWWVSGHIRVEREHCCDDAAIAVGGDVLAYVNALAELAVSQPARLAAVAANGGSLADRIARLLGERRPATGRRGTVLGVVMLAAASYCVFAQSDARPTFQAASIKQNASLGPSLHLVLRKPGGRLTADNAPLKLLIQNAYAVQAYQILGGPGWINSDGYDIEAKPETDIDYKQMELMLQSLLAERFKLTLHRETRELPVYTLTAAKSGLKLPLPKEGACVSPPPGAPLPPPQAGAAMPCGTLGVGMGETGLRMQGNKVSITELVAELAAVLGVPVLDKTDFIGKFNVDLSFTPDENIQGLGGTLSAAPPPPDPARPNIFTALQEQMGLKLTSSKGPVEVLVIDRVERPTAN